MGKRPEPQTPSTHDLVFEAVCLLSGPLLVLGLAVYAIVRALS